MSKRSPVDEAVLASLIKLVEPLNRALGGSTEIVVHDLDHLPNSIAAIAGSITGRRIGGPATDMLLRAAMADDFSTMVGYETRLPDGRRVRSTTIKVEGEDGRAMATLCINTDVTMWEPIQEFVAAMLPGGHWPGRPADQPHTDVDVEHFEPDIDSLAERLLSQAVTSVGVPVELMRKRHKIAVVAKLKEQGYFLLREAVDNCANELQVTRYTVYNYLNELDGEAPVDAE